ncbi:hypothetical protein F5887DRAFT_1076974 [Amanita rubescens]|nr:hypothetical protein F5887DRAFT_1076974 [Amanita rubescens]
MDPTPHILSIGSVSFIDSINQRCSSKRTTKELVKQALLLVNAASTSPKFQLQWLRRYELDLELFLRTMLECAPTASSRRYVASAITGCSVKEWSSPETAENLRELAINWFGHLFWTFKSAGADGMFPTNNEIQDYFLREQVMQRHGNRCTVTGVYDWCRARRHQVPKASLDYACILPRTARLDGCREELSQSIHEYFSPKSWDILQNYAPVTFDGEEDLLAELESSANAIAMEVDAGDSFQQFLFTLEPTQVPDEYDIVAYDHAINELCAIPPLQGQISLRTPAPTVSSSGIPTPSSSLLQVHAAIAKVLHRSRAGMAIDRINEYLGSTHPTLRNLDFDSARVSLELGESVERMFASIPREKKRTSRDDRTSGRHEAIIRQELKKRRTS